MNSTTIELITIHNNEISLNESLGTLLAWIQWSDYAAHIQPYIYAYVVNWSPPVVIRKGHVLKIPTSLNIEHMVQSPVYIFIHIDKFLY